MKTLAGQPYRTCSAEAQDICLAYSMHTCNNMHQMIQGECQKCEAIGETHGTRCIVRKLIFDRDFKQSHVTREQALEAAVKAIEVHHTNKERENMTTQLPALNQTSTELSLAQKFGFTESQLDLIRRTVAKNATDDELEIFFYRCKMYEANPLMPGEIYFVKFGNSPGTVITGIDTFRNQAHKTGLLAGVKRGVIRDKNGVCVGGWADVYRSDWKEPAHEEVALSEYTTGKANWSKMPETMIKKVAEVAAYRIAFPKQLGGLYVREEMEKVTKDVESFQEDPQKVQTPIIGSGPTKAQLGRLFAIAKSKGMTTKDEVKNWIGCTFDFNEGFSLTQLTCQEYDDVCKQMEKIPVIQSPQPIEVKLDETLIIEHTPEPKPATQATRLPWDKYLDDRLVK